MEQAAGIEPAPSVWKTDMLPLNTMPAFDLLTPQAVVSVCTSPTELRRFSSQSLEKSSLPDAKVSFPHRYVVRTGMVAGAGLEPATFSL